MNELQARLLQRGGRFALPVPDAVMALLFAVAPFVPWLPHVELFFGLLVEGGFLMMQGTLVDIASRMKKRPPIWAIPIIVGVVLMFNNEALGVVKMAWQRGAIVFVPLLLSLLERGMVLWRLPDRPVVEKMAARALIGNRITTAIGVLAIFAALSIANMAAGFTLGDWPMFALGAFYFAVAAFDDWRVRGKRFAENPRVLFGFDPLGVKYLEPV